MHGEEDKSRIFDTGDPERLRLRWNGRGMYIMVNILMDLMRKIKIEN